MKDYLFMAGEEHMNKKFRGILLLLATLMIAQICLAQSDDQEQVWLPPAGFLAVDTRLMIIPASGVRGTILLLLWLSGENLLSLSILKLLLSSWYLVSIPLFLLVSIQLLQ